MKTARYLSEQAGLILAGSFLLWPEGWQLAAFLLGLVLAVSMNRPVQEGAHIAILLTALAVKTMWEKGTEAAGFAMKIAFVVCLAPFLALFMLATIGRRV